jgi:hypothetical protein
VHRLGNLTSKLFVTAALVGGLVVAGAPRAMAAGSNDFSIAPATIEGSRSPRAFFDLDVSPGQVIHDRVTVVNRTDANLNVNVYSADAYNIPLDGGFALRTLKEKRVDVGAWTRVPFENLSVPAHSQSTFPIDIRIPANASPGDHAGGVVAVNTTQSIQQEGNARIAVNKAVGARIYLRVKGPLRPSVDVTRIHVGTSIWSAWPLQGGNPATVSYDVVNTGNTRVDATATPSVTDVLGRTVKRFDGHKLSALLPGQKVTITERWSHVPALPLRLTPHVVVRRGSSRSTAQGAPSYVIPWLLLLVVAAVVGWWQWRRRRRAPRTPPLPFARPKRQRVGV